MILMIYKNGLCDPAKQHGVMREFENSSEGRLYTDRYIHSFIASVDPKFLSNYKIFVCNDEVDYSAVDHWVLMDEPLESKNKGFTEIDVYEVAGEVNEQFKALDKRHRERLATAKKNVEQYIAQKVHVDLEKAEDN